MIKNGYVAPGSTFRVTVNFQDNDGAGVDPETVVLQLRSPRGSETTLTYGADAELQREAAGLYLADLSPDCSGRWHIRWESTGVGKATAVEDSFIVQKSPFNAYNDSASDYV